MLLVEDKHASSLLKRVYEVMYLQYYEDGTIVAEKLAYRISIDVHQRKNGKTSETKQTWTHFWFQHLGLNTRLDRKTTGCNSDMTVSHFPVKAKPLPPQSLTTLPRL